ncbi:MAG: hypothetical protein JWN52_4384 [Actinomycetia bacterium]|nr:hypothetical protein [Actinomycetes bacterium]
MMSAVTSTVLAKRRRRLRSDAIVRQPSLTAATREVLSGRAGGTGSGVEIARIPHPDNTKLIAFRTIVTTGPSAPMRAPPDGGPTAVQIHMTVSNRPLASIKCRWGMRALRCAPPAPTKTMSAKVTTTATASS